MDGGAFSKTRIIASQEVKTCSDLARMYFAFKRSLYLSLQVLSNYMIIEYERKVEVIKGTLDDMDNTGGVGSGEGLGEGGTVV